MENSSQVNQTLNSSELQSLLGEGGHLALNLISLLLFALPTVLSNGFVIIILLIDKTTVRALRIALINILVCAMITGIGLNTRLLAQIARIAGLASDHSVALASRIALALSLSSIFLRSIALSILAVVVYIIIKKGPPKKVGVWCLSTVAIGFLLLAVIFVSLQASDLAFEQLVVIDGYHTFLAWSNFGKYLVLSTEIIIEIPSKTVTITFAALTFRYVKHTVCTAVETGIRNAMLKFLISTIILNAIVTVQNLSFVGSLFWDDPKSIQQNSSSYLVPDYIGRTAAALCTILIPIILTVQFSSVSTTLKGVIGCRKVTSKIHPS